MVVSIINNNNVPRSSDERQPRDDESTSSTLTMDVLDSKQEPQQQQENEDDGESSQPERRVRFDLSRNQEQVDERGLLYEDLQELALWYTRQEVKAFKKITASYGSELAYQDKQRRRATSTSSPFFMTYTSIVSRTYETCRRAPAGTRQCLILGEKKDRDELYRYLNSNDNDVEGPVRVGLERWICKYTIERDRMARKFHIVQVVLDLQDEFNSNAMVVADNGVDEEACRQNIEKNEECLRQASERISLPSRLFARAMADAQVGE